MNKSIDILIAADTNITRPWFRDRIPAINQAFNEIEWRCELCDIYGLLGQHKCMPTNTKDRRKFLQNTNLIEANNIFVNQVLTKRPKVLILSTADNYKEFILPSTIQQIRSKGVFVVGTLGDDEFNYPDYRFMLGWFDMFIAYVKPCLNYYEGFGLAKGYYLPNSCFLNNIAFEDHDQVAKYDTILIGSPTANRPEMVKALIDAGLNVAIYGSKQWEKYSFTNGHYFGFVKTENFDNVLREGKTILAFLEDHITGDLHMNTKIWEAVRVGRLPICTHYECLSNDYRLTDDVDIVMYKNTKDLVDKVHYYANNNNKRINVAQNLYNRVVNEFDYSILYKNLFNHLMVISDSYDENNNQKEAFSKRLSQINFEGAICFSSKNVHYDYDVINSIAITKKLIAEGEKIQFIYFDRLERGKRTINRRPFINLDSVVFFNTKKHWSNVLTLPFVFFFGKAFHVKQFSVISDRNTAVGFINRLIDQVLSSEFGNYLKRYHQTFKRHFIKLRFR